MTEITFKPKGDNYMLIRKDDGRPFKAEFLQPQTGGRLVSRQLPLGITAAEKRILDKWGNLIIAQSQWQIWNMGDDEYVVERY